eukprot:4883154-Pleurochrysis_carterae.AAC.2
MSTKQKSGGTRVTITRCVTAGKKAQPNQKAEGERRVEEVRAEWSQVTRTSTRCIELVSGACSHQDYGYRSSLITRSHFSCPQSREKEPHSCSFDGRLCQSHERLPARLQISNVSSFALVNAGRSPVRTIVASTAGAAKARSSR